MHHIQNIFNTVTLCLGFVCPYLKGYINFCIFFCNYTSKLKAC